MKWFKNVHTFIIIICIVLAIVAVSAIIVDIYAYINKSINCCSLVSILSSILSIFLTIVAIIYTFISGAKMDKKIDEMSSKISEWYKNKPVIDETKIEIEKIFAEIKDKVPTKEQAQKLIKYENSLKENMKNFLSD